MLNRENNSPLPQSGEGQGERERTRKNTLASSPSIERGERRWLGLAAVVIALDQFSKLWISSRWAYGESYTVTDFFNLVLAHNSGASFSMLSDAGGWQRWFFSGIAIVASVWIIWLLRKHQQEKLFCIALAFILGGALGNLIDRLVDGYVVDFIDFHWNLSHFAAFNVADSAINLGAALLLWDSFKNKAAKK